MQGTVSCWDLLVSSSSFRFHPRRALGVITMAVHGLMQLFLFSATVFFFFLSLSLSSFPTRLDTLVILLPPSRKLQSFLIRLIAKTAGAAAQPNTTAQPTLWCG